MLTILKIMLMIWVSHAHDFKNHAYDFIKALE